MAMATMYVVTFVKILQNKKMKKKDIESPISTMLITDRQIWYACVSLQCQSSELPFYLIPAILLGKWRKMHLPLQFLTY